MAGHGALRVASELCPMVWPAGGGVNSALTPTPVSNCLVNSHQVGVTAACVPADATITVRGHSLGTPPGVVPMEAGMITRTNHLFLAVALSAGAALLLCWAAQAGAPVPTAAAELPKLSVGDASVAEGYAGLAPLSFQITLSPASAATSPLPVPTRLPSRGTRATAW